MGCKFLLSNGLECGYSPSGKMNPVIAFRNPYKKEKEKWQESEICQRHSDDLIGELLYAESNLISTLSTLKEEWKTERKKLQSGEIHYMPSTPQKIERLEKLLKTLRFDTCPSCNKKFDDSEIVYAVMALSSTGRNRHMFHYHADCQAKLMVKVGLVPVFGDLEKYT